MKLKNIKRNILLNPGPATTTDSVKYSLVVPDICPRERGFGQIVEKNLVDLVKIVNGEKNYKCVIFSGSGTASVDATINSVVPEAGKILVVSNGAYGIRMTEIAESYGINVVRYEIPYGDYPDIDKVEKLLIENKNELTHLGIVHHETTTGMLNPIEDYLKLARKYNLEIIVDTISSYAGIPINLEETDYDYIMSTSNKNIQGMAGLSFVICKGDSLKRLKSIPKRSYYLNLYQQYEFFRKYKQMQFTPPVQVFYALRQAIKEYFDEGGGKRYKRYCENWQALVDGLTKIGFKLLLPMGQQSKLLTAVLEPGDKNYSFNEMHDYLFERDFTIYPGKGAKEATFRIANIGEIYKSDIESFLEVLKEYINKLNIKKF